MARISSISVAIWAILIASTPFLSAAEEDVNYGLSMASKAFSGVCWIEKLHKFPVKAEPLDERGIEGYSFGDCVWNTRAGKNEWESYYNYQAETQRKYGNDPDKMTPKLTNWAMKGVKGALKRRFKYVNPEYRASCEKFVDAEKEGPTKDFSSLLEDSAEYPFKGVAHCILEVAERRNGKEEMAALKTRWISPKSFLQSIIDRENEHRARHGTPPLQLDSELSTRAQRWADKLAAADFCKGEHIDDPESDYRINGSRSGENLMGSSYKDLDDVDTGMAAANAWYSEIQYYPWPQYTGNVKGIGHFTQSIWKSTKLAGYGFGRSPGCKNVFVVGRYFPQGNIQSAGMPFYKENVLPPIV